MAGGPLEPSVADGTATSRPDNADSARSPRWRRALGALAQFVFPRVCAACDAALDDSDHGLICGRCWARVPTLRAPRCDRCGHPRPARGGCPGCVLLPKYVRSARSYCWVPDDASSGILSALKYHGWRGVADPMGQRLARLEFPQDAERERCALVPVPLAAAKLRERGFNQADALAQAVATRWQIPVWTDLLTRERATPSQTRLTPGERMANVHGAFSLGNDAEARIRGRHLVLVDDVLTTGATLNACAAVLFAGGARTLSYLTFGRARSGADRR